jgi:hypothetical protein
MVEPDRPKFKKLSHRYIDERGKLESDAKV